MLTQTQECKVECLALLKDGGKMLLLLHGMVWAGRPVCLREARALPYRPPPVLAGFQTQDVGPQHVCKWATKVSSQPYL
jgi:hypothetical protein